MANTYCFVYIDTLRGDRYLVTLGSVKAFIQVYCKRANYTE